MGAWGLVLLIAIASILLVECKECTTPSKPHLSRCDMYYKCMVLPSQTIVWIPSKCDRGLIYEPGLQLCVLPADDWECSLGEPETAQNQQDDRNVYGVSNLDYLQNEINNYRPQFYDSSVNTGVTPDLPMKSTKLDADGEEDTVLMISDDADEGDSVEVVQDLASNESEAAPADSDEDFESSGDGPVEPSAAQVKSNYLAVHVSSEQDGAVASHLQRLSQLIQSMSNAQQNADRNQTENTELTPNDLNAFLANYNIQHQVQPPSNAQKLQMSPDGKIPADRLLEILRLQQKIQSFSNDDSRMPPTPVRFQDKVGAIPTAPTKPPTRPSVVPVKTVRINGHGHNTAQIVVNRPEGSVLFSLPGDVSSSAAGANQQEPIQNYISQETLKAVLDLSKQMIASNTQQQQSYLQQPPILRPIYYTVPIHDLPIPILSGYKDSTENNRDKHRGDNIDDGKMEMVSSVKGHADTSGDDRTTVIHNHIPITIENRKAVKPTSKPFSIESVTETRYDSFGEKIITASNSHQDPNRVLYPPYDSNQQQQQPFYGQNSHQSSLPQYQNYYPLNTFPYKPQQLQPLPQQQPQFAPFSNQNYPTTPHLSEFNINSYVNLNTPAYPTLRPADAATGPAPPASQYSEKIPFRRPQYHHQPTAFAQQPQQPFDTQYNTFTQFDRNDDITSNNNNNIVDESYDHDLDPNLDVFDELTSLGQPLNQKPSSSAASNLESKQSLESMHGQLKPLATGSQPSVGDSAHHNKIVHYGSTFMSYDDYQQSVAPLLEQGGAQNVEVLACITGARQPNSQDCSKYFVCNAATHKVLDYVCPQFTAFNRQSRFCDAKTYAECKGESGEKPAITVDANRRIHQEAKLAKEALEQATRYRDELIRDQQLTSQINQQTQMLLQNKRMVITPTTQRPIAATAVGVAPSRRKPVTLAVTPTTVRPRRPQAPRTRIIKCSEPTKVRDSLSIYNYFTCFKAADGSLKALKQTCPGGLVFCERMKMCTSQSRC